MTIEHLIAFNLTLLAAIASPGPALLVAIRTTLSSGRRSGMAVGFGLGLVAATWTLMALLGLDAIFTVVPWAYTVTKTAGAAYLLYIAWGMWKGARDGITAQVKPARHAFRDGLMVNLLNPKAVLFAAAVLVVIFPQNMTATDKVIVVTNHLLVELAFYTTLALAMSHQSVSDRYMRAKLYIDRTASGILGLLGLRLLADR